VDSVASIFFVTDGFAHANIFNEGIPEDCIFFVGNVMVDSLEKFLPLSKESGVLRKLELEPKRYAVLSLHRKMNTCNIDTLRGIISAARQISEKIPVVFACFKRVEDDIERFGLGHYFENNRMLSYVVSRYPDFLALESNALFLMTDSGTMQVESSALGIPCLTLRTNTEWIVTVKEGTNKIVGPFPEKIIAGAESIINNGQHPAGVPKYWDGHSAERIVEVIAKSLPFEDSSTRKIRTISVSD
jgi:UDP-N-acetylglucosamine 2-epimerase (non-hydrolysing)